MPTIIEVDCSTGISTEREMTAEEVANIEAIQAAEAARQHEAEVEAAAVAEAKASAEAKLEALGLTAEEIAALTK
jgi:hypothetical protein